MNQTDADPISLPKPDMGLIVSPSQSRIYWFVKKRCVVTYDLKPTKVILSPGALIKSP
jgi:hypothetical protein